MDVQRQILQDDLRGVLQGDVRCDPVTCTLYASDASIYEVPPLGVVRPRNVADVVATVRYAAQHDLPIQARGAGSGLSGAVLGGGVVLDFSRYMRRIELIDGGRSVRVSPGAPLADVNQQLQPLGRVYGPDPATRSVTTMGSVLSVNASGSHYPIYGSARDTIESMQIVTAAGDVLPLSRHDLDGTAAAPPSSPPADEPTAAELANHLARGLANVKRRFHDQLNQYYDGRSPSINGYRLEDTVFDDHVEMAKFMVGTQGTLGIVTDAVLRTDQRPAHRGVLLAFFSRLDAAADAATIAMQAGAVACDLMDRRCLIFAREVDRRYEQLLPGLAEAMLLVEMQGETATQLRERLLALKDALVVHERLAFSATETIDPQRRNFFWRLCRRVIPGLYRMQGMKRPLPVIEDIVVPPQTLREVLPRLRSVMQQFQCTSTLFAHAGHGQLHLRPFLDLASPDDRRLIPELSLAVAKVAWEYGGTIGAEHAAGLSRSWLLPRQYGDAAAAMAAVKQLFDPAGRLSPGKLSSPTPPSPDQQLRHVSSAPQNDLPLVTLWDGDEMMQSTRQCNGCGRCRTIADSQRQCPMFRVLPAEEASPRAKANLLRSVLSGQVPVETLSDDAAKRVADLCFGCHQCKHECPATVDIPRLVTELKGQYVATNGLRPTELFAARIENLAWLASRFPRTASAIANNPLTRYLLERVFGLSRARPMPDIASQTFLRLAARRRWNRGVKSGDERVAYFVDHYVNYHDPRLGTAFASVLQHNQIPIFVPPGQVSSGMPRFIAGDLASATSIAKRNVKVLADAVRGGYRIVASEPSVVFVNILTILVGSSWILWMRGLRNRKSNPNPN
ncbi:MAG: FAD-linked oxidase C-terminal domain-containing protein, partial [Planctomycetota bacterium]